MRSAEVLPVVIMSISIVPVCWWDGKVERLNTNGECQVNEPNQRFIKGAIMHLSSIQFLKKH
jgi:hypothetical protein